MTLVITTIAAVACTAIWYKNAPESKMNLGLLCWLYWGASIMWFADAVFEYAEKGAEYFNQSPEDMLNDLYLGISVITLGLVVWIVVLLIKDPKGVIKAKLFKK